MKRGHMDIRVPVNEENKAEAQSPLVSGVGEIHILMTCLDYPGSNMELTATKDGDHFKELAEYCGVTDITYLKNEECHKPNVKKHLKKFCKKCTEDDWFIYFYAGHGTQVPDLDGDESDGFDEALVLVSPQGRIGRPHCLIDDELADVLCKYLHPDAHMLIITDCCHSGSIADLDKEQWQDRKVVAIGACHDDQTAGDKKHMGGILTSSMLCAVQAFQDEDNHEYTCANLYNRTVDKDDELFGSKQDIMISAAPGFHACEMSWPLVPQGGYEAPYEHYAEKRITGYALQKQVTALNPLV